MNALISYKPFYGRTKRADDFRSLFRRWHNLLSWSALRLSKTDSPDHPFWYGERTNVGWIALAAYKKGWLPIHEPSITRKKRVRSRGKVRTKKIAGRSDLWIFKGQGKNQIFFDLEAKEADLSLRPFLASEKEFSFPRDIRTKLKAAVRDVSNKDKEIKGDVGIGIVFIRLYLRQNPTNATKKVQIAALKRFKYWITNGPSLQQVDADFIALHFAPYPFVKKVADTYQDDYIDLGLAIIGKMKKLWQS